MDSLPGSSADVSNDFCATLEENSNALSGLLEGSNISTQLGVVDEDSPLLSNIIELSSISLAVVGGCENAEDVNPQNVPENNLKNVNFNPNIATANGVLVDTSSGLLCVPIGDGTYRVYTTGESLENLQETLQLNVKLQEPVNQETNPLNICCSDVVIQNEIKHSTSTGIYLQENHLCTANLSTGENLHQVTETNKRKGGWPKGKSRSKKRPVQKSSCNAPKPPVTGYLLFLRKRRLEMVKTTGNHIFPSEMMKKIGQEWTRLPKEEKQIYLDQAKASKKKYIEEMEAYRESASYKALQKQTNGLLENESLHDVSDDRYCSVCDQYFITVHNKKEHLLGKNHLRAVTLGLQMRTEDISKGPDELKNSSFIQDHTLALPGSSESTPDKLPSPIDVEGYKLMFLETNLARERELQHLRRTSNELKASNSALCKTVYELKEMQMKLQKDLSSLKTWETTQKNHIDRLTMVPHLFGVINF